MEEDMKKTNIKNIVENFEEFKAFKEHIGDIDKDFFFEFADYLIARNKELEAKQCVYKNTSSCTRALSFETYTKLNNDYISKSEIRELQDKYKKEIEKLENKRICDEPQDLTDKHIYRLYYKAYQKLLEEGDE